MTAEGSEGRAEWLAKLEMQHSKPLMTEELVGKRVMGCHS